MTSSRTRRTAHSSTPFLETYALRPHSDTFLSECRICRLGLVSFQDTWYGTRTRERRVRVWVKTLLLLTGSLAKGLRTRLCKAIH